MCKSPLRSEAALYFGEDCGTLPRVALREYIHQRVEGLCGPNPGLILDVGCGDGRFVIDFHARWPGKVFGYDIPRSRERCRRRVETTDLATHFEDHFRFSPPGSRLPFPDRHFDLVLSNQVVEHVEDLHSYFAGCASALREDGVMLCIFPPRSHVIEAHARVPFAHWWPGGVWRQRYLSLTKRWADIPRQEGTMPAPIYWDKWLKNYTFYRSPHQVWQIASTYFAEIEDDAKAYQEAVCGHMPLGLGDAAALGLYYAVNTTMIFRKPKGRAS